MPSLLHSARGTAKILAFTLWTLLLVPAQSILLFVLQIHGPTAYKIPYLWQRGVCRIFNLKIDVRGTPSTDTQTIFVCNHVSYLDIPALASILKASFIAKAEVASWPVFGFLSMLQQTAFISRARQEVVVGRNALEVMLRDGKSLVLFPEGTSTDGRTAVPFKSSLFSMVCGDFVPPGIKIQPVTLAQTHAEGRPVATQADRDLYAWYGDMDMAPHLWHFACTNGATLRITFHPARTIAPGEDRKSLAASTYADVLTGFPDTQTSPLANCA